MGLGEGLETATNGQSIAVIDNRAYQYLLLYITIHNHDISRQKYNGGYEKAV